MTARYEDWHHTRYEGDVDAGKALLPLARKVLGYTVQEAGRQGLQTFKHVHRQDGVEIVGELIGGQPRVTIRVVRPEPPRERIELDDFVVWARDVDHPDGIDATYPQQILRPEWTTYFYSGSIDGYDAFPGNKNVYLNPFSTGLRHAGNLDWEGPDKVRVSWYGPSTRYFFDPFVRSKVQYGHQVFMLGQVVLDLSTHDDSTPTTCLWVMGAAINGNDLYVVQAQLPDEPTTTGTVNANVQQCDSMYTTGDIPHELHRYSLIPDPALPISRIAASDSREILWAGTIPRGCSPWFFDPDAVRAHTFAPAPGFTGAGNGITVFIAPPTESPVHTLTDAGSGWALTTTQVSTVPDGMAALAGDYKRDGSPVELRVLRERLEFVPYNGPPGNMLQEQVSLQIGDMTVPMKALDRTGVLAFCRDEETADPTELGAVTTHRTFEVWADGGRVHEQEVAFDPAGFTALNDTGLRREFIGNTTVDFSSFFKDLDVAPGFFIHNIVYNSDSSLNFRSGFYGFHAGLVMLARQPAAYYGSFHFMTSLLPTPGSPLLYVADRCNVIPGHERLDFDGKDIITSCAAARGVLVYSGHSGVDKGLDSVHFVTGQTLQALTGVAGEQERYHPVWRLGLLPVGA